MGFAVQAPGESFTLQASGKSERPGEVQWRTFLGFNPVGTGTNWPFSEDKMEVLPALHLIFYPSSIGIYFYCLIYSSIDNISANRSHSAVKTAAVMQHKRLMERQIFAFWTIKKKKIIPVPHEVFLSKCTESVNKPKRCAALEGIPLLCLGLWRCVPIKLKGDIPYWLLIEKCESKGGKLSKWIEVKCVRGRYAKLNILISHMGLRMLLS